MKKLFIIFSVIVLQSCDNFTPKPDEVGDLLIRIENATSTEMQNVYVNTAGGEGSYGDVPKNEKSHYINYKSAYRYAFVRFVSRNDTVRVQPIDYVGEQQLTSGSYTYKITMTNKNSDFANIELTKD
ncbi:MAG: hypothetical protein NWP83_06355 [Spirosomaceae bacterium]|nr:hypothetical protein [Spirosomataceae bacterium]